MRPAGSGWTLRPLRARRVAVVGPMPGTRALRSSRSRNGPRARSSTMRRALAGPMPRMLRRSSMLAWLMLTMAVAPPDRDDGTVTAALRKAGSPMRSVRTRPANQGKAPSERHCTAGLQTKAKTQCAAKSFDSDATVMRPHPAMDRRLKPSGRQADRLARECCPRRCTRGIASNVGGP